MPRKPPKKLYKEIYSRTQKSKWNFKNSSTGPWSSGKRKQKNKNRDNKHTTKSKTGDLSPDVSIITLNANGVNTPTKRQRLSE